MSYDKYIKYKIKYSTSKWIKQIGGENRKKILLTGISSSGKTTIGKLFAAIGYKYINIDDYDEKKLMQRIDTNRYYTKSEKERLRRQMMFEEGQKHDLVVYDDFIEMMLSFDPDLFVIVIYASLNQLVDNIYSRRFTEPRGKFVFIGYTNMFEKANVDEQYIDLVDKKSFIEKLKSKVKYLFSSEENLLHMADSVFNRLKIKNDDRYPIKLKDSYRCDYLLNASDKTIVELGNLINKISNNVNNI